MCAAAALAQQGEQAWPLSESDMHETYAVYSALIRSHVGAPPTGRLPILAFTRTARNDASCLKAPAGAREADYRQQIAHYLQLNRTSYRLLPRFDPGQPYDLVVTPPEPTPPRRFSFYVVLSAVGFNSARNRAVVYVENGGMGGAYFVTKTNGKWTVDPYRMPPPCGWIS
jgi:hypothetical protein